MNCIKKIRKKMRFVITVALICALVVPSTVAFASPIMRYGHRMSGGIGNIYIYIDDKAPVKATYWQNLIKIAVNNWMYTGVGANKFYCQGYVSSGTSGSKIDFYARGSDFLGGDGGTTLGATTWWSYSMGLIDPYSSDWYSAQIDLNDTGLRSNSVSNDDAICLILHEMGHAFGLFHSTDKASVMWPDPLGATVRRVQKVDNDALNELY